MSTNKWTIDPTHSEIQFKVKHLMISTVTGHFTRFHGQAFTENDDFTTVKDVSIQIDTASVDTNNKDRDIHLRSADFFNSEVYTQIVFTGTDYSQTADGAQLTGTLVIRGIARAATFDIEFGGIVVDPYGQTKAGFTVTGTINRKDFGLTWSALTEAGNVVVSDEVRFTAEIQMVRQND